MATIDEDYVSFEIAKLLKEKGFDEHCFCINYPLPEGEHHNIILPNLLNNSMIPFTDEYNFCRYKEDFITIPTLQMVMKWLREVHKLFIQIRIIPHTTITMEQKYYLFTIHKDRRTLAFRKDFQIEYYFTYEEACEAAIKYCLENLI